MNIITIDVHTDMAFDVHFAWPASTADAFCVPTYVRVVKADRALKAQAASINQRMLEAIERDPEKAVWPIRRWARELKCSSAGVYVTAAWRRIRKLRGLHQAEAVDRAEQPDRQRDYSRRAS